MEVADVTDAAAASSAVPHNICIIAHVDHGKTTMADSLLASNGIVSHRLAGLGLRYMDSRDDEQDRGITMKASCIALTYESDVGRRAINLIDSPGHVDFCSEVASAARLSDGALLVVDAVEGVCVQTHAVLKQAWEEHVSPVLVLNKIDRLITELELSPLEAWHHLKNVVEQVNAIAGHLYTGAVLEADAKAHTEAAAAAAADGDDASGEVASVADLEALQSAVGELQFAPEKGNVLFASAMHGWGFSLHDFASLYAAKLGMRQEVLMQTLWGEFYYHPKQKKILRTSQEGKLKPMFVQFVLQTLWHVYTAVVVTPDEAQRTKIVSTLGLDVPSRELKHSDPIVQLRAVMGLWLPLGKNVLRAVASLLPNARDAQRMRLAHLCPTLHAVGSSAAQPDGGTGGAGDDTSAPAMMTICRGIETCDASCPHVVIHVAKMVYAAGVDGAHVDDTFVGFARVFCGTLRPGQGGTLHVLDVDGGGAKGGGGAMEALVPSVEVDAMRLYILMGRELIPTAEIRAGEVCGVGGVSAAVARSATLSTEANCPPFEPLVTQSAPVVQVAVEPTQLSQMGELERGLRLLARADWSVAVDQLPSGEHVLGTCGEVHLERCLHDLKTAFAIGVPLSVSAPIVPLRESIAPGASGRADATTASKQATLGVRALAIPEAISACLREEGDRLRAALHTGGGSWAASAGSGGGAALDALRTLIEAEGKQWSGLLPLSASPLAKPENLLLCTASVLAALRGTNTPDGAPNDSSGFGVDLLPSVLTGFQLSAGSGPLCEEPMSGVVLVIDELTNSLPGADADADDALASDAGLLEGQMIVAAKDACRSAMLQCSCRVLEPVYDCELQTTQDSMGRTYGVLAKRRAQVLSEELKEGTPIFTIRAHLPVAESFGFAADLRKNTSGAAHPQLVFSHFEPLSQDPNFTVATEEEQENLDGGDYDGVNLARKLVDAVRRRKGLRVEEKAVKSATKQRTRTKMK